MKGIQKDYNIDERDLHVIFEAVSRDHKDMLEYMYSGGSRAKSHLMWNKEEDDTLRENHRNLNHYMMKVLMRLKGPERIEKRVAYLGLI